MDKMIAGLLGAMAGAAGIVPAHAATAAPLAPDTTNVMSYADLLAPVPNAQAALRADDTAKAAARANEMAGVQMVQYYYYYGQPAPYGYPTPYGEGQYIPYPNQEYYSHHHHHHHHHHHNQDYGWQR